MGNHRQHTRRRGAEMKPEEALKQFKEWNESGWSKSETPSSEALVLAIQALGKQVPKKPIHAHGNYYCPTCKDTWLLWDDAIPNEDDNFCRYCGQKIDWEAHND